MSSSGDIGTAESKANVEAPANPANFGMIGQRQGNGTAGTGQGRVGWGREWQRWAPFAAVAWSLVYAAMGLYWAVSGGGFPYDLELLPQVTASVVG